MEFKNIEELYRARSDEAGATGCSFYLTPMEWTALADAIEALRELHGWTPKTCPKVLRGFECAPCSALARLDNL